MKHTIPFIAALLTVPLAALSAAEVPRSVTELWADFDPRKDPLETEILRVWEQDGVVCQLVRYQVGVFKGAPAKVAGFYAFPKGGTKLPALLSMHGGGQSAGLDGVVAEARRGYAAISINWGGNRLNFGRSQMTYDGPQTDWGRLDATHPPQRNKVNHFAGPRETSRRARPTSREGSGPGSRPWNWPASPTTPTSH